MIGKERVVEVLGPALIVALIIGGLPVQLFAPTAEPQLVSYVVTWHATARGSGHRTWPSGETEGGLTHFAEMRGYAIVRFEQPTDGRQALVMYDTRYISVNTVDSWQAWRVSHWQMGAKPGPSFECPSCVEVKPHSCTESAYASSDITDPSENSGLYIRTRDLNHQLLGDWRKRPDGVVVFPWAFAALGYLEFTHHATTFVQESAGCGQAERRDISYKSSPGGALLTPPAELRQLDEKYALALPAVNAKDDSSFAMNVRFSDAISGEFSIGGIDQVEWTAEAHRLGTCPCMLHSSNAALPASGLAWAAAPPRKGTPPQSQCTPSLNWVCFDDPALKKGQAKEVIDVSLPNGSETDPNGTLTVRGSSTPKIKGLGVKVKVTTCDGIPVKGETVQITIDPKENSGGHTHAPLPPRPGGMLNDKEIDKPQPKSFVCPKDCIEVITDDKGYAYGAAYPGIVPAGTIRFRPPSAGEWGGHYEVGIAGDYEITARSNQFQDRKGSAVVQAHTNGIGTMPPINQNYVLDRGGTDDHPDGFYATDATKDAFTKLGADFLKAQRDHNDKLKSCKMTDVSGNPLNKNIWDVHYASINDIALPMGGVFDLGPQYFGKWWRAGVHQTHNKGQGGDFNRYWKTKYPELWNGNNEVNVTDCDDSCSQPPCETPFRSWLLFTLLEYGKSACAGCKWDCKDLKMTGGVPQGGPTNRTIRQQCEEGEFQEAFPMTNPKQTLHLHVQD